MANVTRVPVGIVVGKRNRERLEEVGVTDETAFKVLKDALEATKVITTETKSGKTNRNVPDYDTRLKAVRLYMELTRLDPVSAEKDQKTMAIDVSSMEGLPEKPVVLEMPKERPLTLEEAKLRQQQEIERRNAR